MENPLTKLEMQGRGKLLQNPMTNLERCEMLHDSVDNIVMVASNDELCLDNRAEMVENVSMETMEEITMTNVKSETPSDLENVKQLNSELNCNKIHVPEFVESDKFNDNSHQIKGGKVEDDFKNDLNEVLIVELHDKKDIVAETVENGMDFEDQTDERDKYVKTVTVEKGKNVETGTVIENREAEKSRVLDNVLKAKIQDINSDLHEEQKDSEIIPAEIDPAGNSDQHNNTDAKSKVKTRENEKSEVTKDLNEELGVEEKSDEESINSKETEDLKLDKPSDILESKSDSDTEIMDQRIKYENKLIDNKGGEKIWTENDLWNDNDDIDNYTENSENSNLSDDFEQFQNGFYGVGRPGNLIDSKIKIDMKTDKANLLKFAEVLYKCTLCTTIPCILTSKQSFLEHVRREHLLKDSHCHGCNSCALKFRTEEDLREHVIFCHTGNDESMSSDLTGNDIIRSHDRMIDSNNDSDSNSSGHRQFRTKVPKRSKPVQDFESPKQLVDHTGIQTLNGSLDLTKKTCCSEKKIKEEKDKGMTLKKERTNINIKQITDQIIKSDVQGRNVSALNQANLSFVPAYTAEFGKYTKLVREGGNIVYFCQICNWKSPIKTTFQVHCNMSVHKNKVLSADNPNEKCESSSNSPKNERNQSANIKVEKDKSRRDRPALGHDISFGPKMPDQKLFYEFIMKPRGITHSRVRTPVVSPFGTGNFIEDARFTYKRPSEHSVDLSVKKKKKNSKYFRNRIESDSDSDDERNFKNFSQKKEHYSSLSLLRKRLLDDNFHDRQTLGEQSFPIYRGVHREDQCSPTDLSIKSRNTKKDNYYKSAQLNHSRDNQEKNQSVFDRTEEMNGLSSHEYKGNEMVHSDAKRVKLELKGTCKLEESSKLYKCYACPYEYTEVDEYEKHFEKVHKSKIGGLLSCVDNRTGAGARGQIWGQGWGETRSTSDGTNMTNESRNEGSGAKTGDTSGNCEMGENWRVQKLKELLPDYVIEFERGNTSRDFLLQCISVSSGLQDAVMWSSACNRAMRELFPNSQAQRKGKYKKTYYFGITMLEGCQAPEEPQGADGEATPFQPLRDVNIDMDKIVEHIPKILRWTGNMDCGVHRQDLLSLLSDAIQDSDVGNWGAQCNRAIKAVFPNVDMKRKGKYKTYLGVEFQPDALKKLTRNMNCLEERKSPVPHSAENLAISGESFISPNLRSDLPFMDNMITPSYWDKRVNTPENVVIRGNNCVRSKESKRGRTLESLLKGSNSPEYDYDTEDHDRGRTLESLLRGGNHHFPFSNLDVPSPVQAAKTGMDVWSCIKFTQDVKKEAEIKSSKVTPSLKDVLAKDLPFFPESTVQSSKVWSQFFFTRDIKKETESKSSCETENMIEERKNDLKVASKGSPDVHSESAVQVKLETESWSRIMFSEDKNKKAESKSCQNIDSIIHESADDLSNETSIRSDIDYENKDLVENEGDG